MEEQKVQKSNLYKLIVNNHDLERLESKLNIFNPFQTLKVEHYEIRHSNVLAWLLDPQGNHRLGDFFLKKVISEMVLQNEEVLQDDIDLLQIHLSSFHDAIVTREEGSIDIMVRSKSNRLLLLIENKIHSKESSHQLSKYLDFVGDNYGHYQYIIPILLTKAGDEPINNDSYGTFSHEQVYTLIKETLGLKKENTSIEVVNFINFYLSTLEKTLGMDDELKDLCLSIYDEHKEAIDLIIQYTSNFDTALQSCFETFKTEHPEIDVVSIRPKIIRFIPKKLAERLPKRSAGWDFDYPIGLWCSMTSGSRLKMHIEIGPWLDPERRVDFILFLEKNGYKVSKRSKAITGRYSRIVRIEKKVKEWTDSEEVSEILESLYHKIDKEVDRLLDVVSGYDFTLA